MSPRDDYGDVSKRSRHDFFHKGVYVEQLLLDLVQAGGVLRQEEEHLHVLEVCRKLQYGTVASLVLL